MKKVIVALLILVSLNSFSREPVGFLVPVLDRGTKISVYDSPRLHSKILYETTLSKGYLPPEFNNNTDPRPNYRIAYYGIEGDFYKIQYNNEFLWLHRKNVKRALSLKEYFNVLKVEMHISFLYGGFEFFESPNGKKVSNKIVHKLTINKPDEYYLRIPIVEMKNVDGVTWLKIKIGGTLVDEAYEKKRTEIPLKYLKLKKPLIYWFRPYDEKGKVNGWTHGLKEW